MKGKKLSGNIKSCPTAAILFGFTVVMLILYLALPQTEFSDAENRYLTQRPRFNLAGIKDGSYMESFDNYTKEQLPFREFFVKLKAVSEMILLKKENNNIVLGKDGYMFEKLFSPGKRLEKNEECIKKFTEDNDREIYLLIAPNSFEILKEKVPEGLPRIDEKKYIDGFYSDLSSKENLHTIDVYDELRTGSKAGKQVFYKTDHHWTTFGAYLSYGKICESMGIEKEEYTDHKVNLVNDFYGTYQAKYKSPFAVPDTIEYYDIKIEDYVINGTEEHKGLYDMEKTEIYDKYAMFLWGNYGISEIISEKTSTKDELIVIKDSYANCLIPFLTGNFRRIVIIDPRYYGGSLKELMEKEKGTPVLILYNFSNFNEDSNIYKILK
ncbi:MAG: hypothetical protein K6B28_08000 [Lachnospiraceae bacterium]|nr:hypothetical protein [Lachnospiraceae bacterium]